MPKRGKPEPPLLNYGNYGLGGLLGDSGILEWDTSKEYLLSWQLPEDNGLPIDMFLLRYFPVSVTQRDSDQRRQDFPIVGMARCCTPVVFSQHPGWCIHHSQDHTI